MPMLLYCEISPATVRYNKSLVFQKNWFITDINQKQVKEEQEEKILVKEVTGKTEAFPGQKAEYRVTRYNRDKVSDADRNSVKWAIKTDGNQEELKNKKGEKVTVEIKKEWAGKEIIVMAYLQSPNEKVSVKTAVIKLPLLIGQSDRKPGKEADGIKEARDMHCGDMKKEDIFRIFSDNIIEKYDDDLFTNVDYHFKLFKRMATMLFSQNNIELQCYGISRRFE
jgi:hypothetical protein